jgi:hypothetical protein
VATLGVAWTAGDTEGNGEGAETEGMGEANESEGTADGAGGTDDTGGRARVAGGAGVGAEANDGPRTSIPFHESST